jgi:RecB family exonuclease
MRGYPRSQQAAGERIGLGPPMPTKRLYISGSVRVLEEAFVAFVRTLRARDPLGPLWVVVPTNLLRLHLARQVAELERGHANVRFFTLADLARTLGLPSGPDGTRVASAREIELAAARACQTLAADDPLAPLQSQPGLHRAIVALAADLDDARVSPHRLSALAPHLTEEQRERIERLARLVDALHATLRAAGLRRPAETLTAALDALAAGARVNADVLLVYGFYDFTPLQRALIAAAVETADAIVWMPWDEGPAFAYATPTRTWFQNLGFAVTPLPVPAAADGDLRRVQTGVFAPPALDGRPPDGSLEIITAPGETREAGEIVRAILRLYQRGIAFHDIGVLVRAADPYADLIGDALERATIPHYRARGIPLAATGGGRALRLLLQVRAEHFARARVVEWLAAAPPPEAGIDAATCEAVSLRAGVVAGADEWRTRLARLAAAPGRCGGLPAAAVEACRRLLDAVIEALSAIPDAGTWSAMSGALLAAYRRLASTPDVAVCEAVQGLAGCDRVAPHVSLAEFAAAVETVLAEVGVRAGRFGAGVCVGEIMQTRGVRFRAVIVPGLVEQVMPRPIHEDPLLRDADREYLNTLLGAELPLKQSGFEEERLLFALMTGAADDVLVLTYPRLDLATGRERLPSWYLLHIMAAVDGRTAGFGDLARWDRVRHVPLSHLIPAQADLALDRAEYDLLRVDAALRGVGEMAAVFGSPLARRAWAAEQARWGAPHFTPYDGVFASADAVTESRAGTQVLSPSRVQAYARCPFAYYVRHLLGIETVTPPEEVAALPPADRGRLVHAILRAFYAGVCADGLWPITAARAAEVFRRLDAVVASECARVAAEEATGPPFLWERTQQAIAADVRALVEADIGAVDGFQPFAFELPFAGTTALTLTAPGTDPIVMRGQIDRLDVAPDGRGRVIDYKTGAPFALPDRVTVRALQLPIYLLAARRLYPTHQWTDAQFVFASAATGVRRASLAAEPWDDRQREATALIAAAVRGMRAGVYPPGKPTCQPCAFPLICGAAGPLFARKCTDPRSADCEALRLGVDP